MSIKSFKKFPHPLISIIIVSYNVKDKLMKCLSRLKSAFEKWEVIIIDNDSCDNSVVAIRACFKEKITLERNSKNVGFAKAVNQGIKLSNGNYILLLNPDTIPSVAAIERLLDVAKKYHNVGIVGGVMLDPKTKKKQRTYVSKPNFLTGIFEFTNLKKIFPNNIFYREFYYKNQKVKKIKDVWGVSGAFMLIKKDVIRKIGGMDEGFFMYLEDVDFCIRARKAGFRVLFYPKASIAHYAGSSSPNKYRINVSAWRHSRRHFFKKHLSFIESCILNLFFLLDEIFVDIKHKICGEE